MLALLLVSGTASAQMPYTYSPAGPVTILTGGGSQKTTYVSIKNETNSNLTLDIQYEGDTNIKFAYAPWQIFTIGPDSGAAFPLTYRGWAGDTSRGILRIWDSVNAIDTIYFTGIDTGANSSPWEILSHNSWAGSYYSLPDSVSLPIRNNSNSAITISASIASGSYGFAASGSQQRSVAANSTSTFVYRFNSSSNNSGEATILFQGAGYSDTAHIHAYKSVPPRDSLYHDWEIEFGTIGVGDTVCRTFTIYNWADTVATLTSFNMLQNSRFYLSNLPSLPLAINPSDSVQITVCFVASTEAGVNSSGYLTLYYSFGNWQMDGSVYLHGASESCFRASNDVIDFGYVVRDASETRSIYLVNMRNESTTVALSLNPTGQGFEILTSSPVTIAAYDTAEVEVRYNATGNSASYAKLVMDGANGCGQVEAALVGRIDDSTNSNDSSAIALYANEERTLDFVGDSIHSTKRYTFYNNQHDPVKIVSVGLKIGTHFTITDIDPSNPEFTLDSGEVMGVTVEFDETPGTYTDTLVIATEDGYIAINFPIHAVINGKAGVGTSPSSVARMMVTPNPSSGPVNISITDANAASIEVLDIMGKRIARFDGSNATLARNDLSAGTYFVRASGVGVDRKPFVMTTRIVIK
jgi:hypothetical protein